MPATSQRLSQGNQSYADDVMRMSMRFSRCGLSFVSYIIHLIVFQLQWLFGTVGELASPDSCLDSRVKIFKNCLHVEISHWSDFKDDRPGPSPQSGLYVFHGLHRSTFFCRWFHLFYSLSLCTEVGGTTASLRHRLPFPLGQFPRWTDFAGLRTLS